MPEPAAGLAAPAGAAGGTWSGGGTADAPFLIEDAADLIALAGCVNGGSNCANQVFCLQGDVDLGGEEWTPIGDAAHPFLGTFLGGGYSVTGLKIRNTGGNSTASCTSMEAAHIGVNGVLNRSANASLPAPDCQ